ncbi:MAG: VWA domain-containing protein [Gammaproteobacteria bacterium]|nr:VWA domain-containing protein [Gammaproteobacteria bacterium]
MLELVWPWIFIVLPVPWLIRRYFKSNHSVQEAALRAPFINDLKSITTRRRSRHTSKKWLLALASLAWIFLIVSAARPQWIGEPIQQTLSQRDMIMAVDLSGSMEVKDFTLNDQWVDRLSATKWVAKRFIKRRHGDRIGLILFGDQAYLQAPLTNDRETVLKFLNEAVIGLAGEKTAIGDAIGLAVKRLQNNPSEQRVLILLTDGANTAGAVSPLKAAELASQYGVRIYTIGLGADELIVRDFFGARRVNPSADLDEKTLKTIADRTGGQYFRARDIEGFEKIYELIDQYEPVDQQAEFFRPRKELYYLPLACAVILGFSIGVIRLIRKQ